LKRLDHNWQMKAELGVLGRKPHDPEGLVDSAAALRMSEPDSGSMPVHLSCRSGGAFGVGPILGVAKFEINPKPIARNGA
jgi:hypothetical protein